MKTKIALFLGLIFAANISYADLKVGSVNIQLLAEKLPQTEKAKKRFDQDFSPRERQLQSQVKEIQSLEEKLSKDAAVLGEQARANLERDILNKKRDFKRVQQELAEDENVRRNEELGKIQRKMIEAIRSFGKEQGFDLLVTDALYTSEQVDVTAQIQQKLASMPE